MKNYKDISLMGTDDKKHSINQIKNKFLILYFYPKDNTPGCTIQGKKYSELIDEFKKNNTIVFGVSKNSLNDKKNFSKKQKFNHCLLADQNFELSEALKVTKMKSMFGKQYKSIIRSTFIFDLNHNLIKEKRNVNFLTDAEENLKFIKEILNKNG